MKVILDQTKIKKWTESVGGPNKATALIMEALECSSSKAEKIANGRYPSGVVPAEQTLLARLTKIPKEVLFALARGKAS